MKKKENSNTQTFTINGKEYKKEWLDLSQIYRDNQDWVKVIVCIGENSIGKTYSVENLFMDYIKEGKNVIWGRNTEKQANTCVNGWKGVLNRYGLRHDYEVIKAGIGKLLPRKNKGARFQKKETELKCPFIYLSSPDNSIPQIENVHLYCIDEFLQGNEKTKFICRNPLYIIRQMMKRTTRDFVNIKPCLFLLANPHNEAEADILSQLGIYPDAEKLYKKEDELWIDKDRGIIYLSFLDTSKWANERLKIQDSYFGSYMDDTSNYHFQNPAFKRIIQPPYTTLQPLLKLAKYDPLFRLSAVIVCRDTATNRMVCIKDAPKYEQMRTFAFDYRCVGLPNVVYLGNNKDAMRQVLNQVMLDLNKSNVYYDCLFIEQLMAEIKQDIERLLVEIE